MWSKRVSVKKEVLQHTETVQEENPGGSHCTTQLQACLEWAGELSFQPTCRHPGKQQTLNVFSCSFSSKYNGPLSHWLLPYYLIAPDTRLAFLLPSGRHKRAQTDVCKGSLCFGSCWCCSLYVPGVPRRACAIVSFSWGAWHWQLVSSANGAGAVRVWKGKKQQRK